MSKTWRRTGQSSCSKTTSSRGVSSSSGEYAPIPRKSALPHQFEKLGEGQRTHGCGHDLLWGDLCLRPARRLDRGATMIFRRRTIAGGMDRVIHESRIDLFGILGIGGRAIRRPRCTVQRRRRGDGKLALVRPDPTRRGSDRKLQGLAHLFFASFLDCKQSMRSFIK